VASQVARKHVTICTIVLYFIVLLRSLFTGPSGVRLHALGFPFYADLRLLEEIRIPALLQAAETHHSPRETEAPARRSNQ
jgi:hypothetical protein